MNGKHCTSVKIEKTFNACRKRNCNE